MGDMYRAAPPNLLAAILRWCRILLADYRNSALELLSHPEGKGIPLLFGERSRAVDSDGEATI
jgi:hypothetical protein